MRVQKRDGYRVVIGGPVPPQAEAITLRKTIFVRKRSCEDQALIAHELVHVHQYAELGAARFLARYVGSYLRYRLRGYGHMAAYRRIPLEVEATWVSRLHPMCELEPQDDEHGEIEPSIGTASTLGARGLRDRLARQRGAFVAARPAPSGGNWSRPRPPADLSVVQAAMASREATQPTSR